MEALKKWWDEAPRKHRVLAVVGVVVAVVVMLILSNGVTPR